MQRLAFSRFIGQTSLSLGPLIKSFLKAFFLMVRRSPVTICLWYLSTRIIYQGELLHLHGRLPRFVKKKSKLRFLTNILKLKTTVDIVGVSL